jgi:hypothetical protein
VNWPPHWDHDKNPKTHFNGFCEFYHYPNVGGGGGGVKSPWPTSAAYIFTAFICTTTILTLRPFALNFEFQHFILRFNKISLLCGYHEVTFRITLFSSFLKIAACMHSL